MKTAIVVILLLGVLLLVGAAFAEYLMKRGRHRHLSAMRPENEPIGPMGDDDLDFRNFFRRMVGRKSRSDRHR